MKKNLLGLKKWIGLAAVATVCSVAQAQNFDFTVDINTTALNFAPNAPFFVDFQLAPGNGTLPNFATISNFVFTGGSATGTPQDFNFGGTTSGDLSSTINLNDAGGFAELFQGFSTSTTDIKFTVTLSNSSTGTIPDGFNIAILDSESGNPQIPTTNVDGLSIVSVALGSSLFPATLSSISTGQTTGADGGVTVAVAAVPEPSIWWMPAMLAVGAVVLRQTRRRTA